MIITLEVFSNSISFLKIWREDDDFHRNDGPAVFRKDGNCHSYKNGNLIAVNGKPY